MTRSRAYFKVKDRRQARKTNPPTSSASPPPQPVARRRSYLLWFAGFAALLAILWLYAQFAFLAGAFFFALLAGSLVEPAVYFFEKRGWSRFTGLAAVFLPGAAMALTVFQIFGPHLTREAAALAILFASPRSEQAQAHTVEFLAGIFPWLQNAVFKQSLRADLARLQHELQQSALDLNTALLTSWPAWAVLAILVFVLLAEGRALRRGLINAVPNHALEKSVWLLHVIPARLQDFLRRQALLALGCAAAMALAFYLMRLPGPFTLGMMAGCCFLTPYFGSLLGAAITLATGVLAAGAFGLTLPILIAFATVDLIKNILLSMRPGKAGVVVGPLETFAGMIAGGSLAGIGGLLFAAPMLALIKIVLQESLNAGRHFNARR